MTALGIHAHPSLRLGRQPPKRAPALKLWEFFDATAAAIPAHGTSDDNLGQLPFVLGANDRFGTCGPTYVANSRVQVTRGAEIPTNDAVFDLYRRSGNPNFDPDTGEDDNGVDMQTMLEALLKGGIAGKKPIAFAQVDITNPQELEAAMFVFDGLGWGVDLQTAQQSQTGDNPPVWDYRSSGDWGGHAILAGRYVDATSRDTVISWQRHVDTTAAFRLHQLEEAWVVVWPEHISRPGVNTAALATAYHQLTGKTLILPGPTPVTPVSADAQLWGAMKAWAKAKGLA